MVIVANFGSCSRKLKRPKTFREYKLSDRVPARFNILRPAHGLQNNSQHTKHL